MVRLHSFRELPIQFTLQDLANLYAHPFDFYSRFKSKQNDIEMPKMSPDIPAEMLEEEFRIQKNNKC